MDEARIVNESDRLSLRPSRYVWYGNRPVWPVPWAGPPGSEQEQDGGRSIFYMVITDAQHLVFGGSTTDECERNL
jgi:hypothetical protein